MNSAEIGSTQASELEPGALAMAALSVSVTAAKPPPEPTDTGHEAVAQAEEDDDDAFMDSRICRPQLRDRIVASLMPGAPHDSTRLEDLAELADAVLADQFASQSTRRQKRR